MKNQKIRVIIVDDSKLMQDLLKKSLTADSDIEVIGCAADPFVARDMIKELNPDVITLDIMMPKMDGITFLKNIMRLRPMPVVMVSSLTKDSQALAVEALELGAIDYVSKPTQKELDNITDFTDRLINSIKVAASANMNLRVHEPKDKVRIKLTDMVADHSALKRAVIAVGASTGGVEALEFILSSLPKIFPAVLVVLHIRREFISSFVLRINKMCNLDVKEAKDGEIIVPGRIYIAPSDYHFVIKNTIEGYIAELIDKPAINGHKPSIDALFESVALVAGAWSVGVLLTGMGKDGANGLKAIKLSGGETIVQDEKTSVVWGMPGAAVQLGVADFVMPLQEIPQKIMNCLDLKMQNLKDS